MKWALGIVLAFVLAVLGYAGYLYVFKLEPMLTHVGTMADVPPGRSAAGTPLSFLLLGIDSRPGISSLNTDVIMIAVINPNKKKAVVVSVPRDTYIHAGKGVRAGKANMYYAAFHSQGAEKSKTQIKDLFGSLLGIPIDYLITVDFQGFQDVVDAVGGITVDVDMDMRYVDEEDGTNIQLTKGTQKLNGKQTLDFVRYRKSNRGTAESNDMQRNKRQQQVIAAIIGRLKSPAGLLKLGSVFDAAKQNMTTDIPQSQIKTMLTTYPGIDHDKIQYIHLDGEWRSPYLYIDQQELAKAKKNVQDALK